MIRKIVCMLCLGQAAVAVAAEITPPVLLLGQTVEVEITGLPPGAQVGLAASGTLAGARACPAQLAPLCLDLYGRAVLVGTGREAGGRATLQVTPPAQGPVAVDLQAAWRVPGGGWTTSAVVRAPLLDPAGDEDRDGLSNADEVLVFHANPRVGDTDGDGLSDGNEVFYGTSPLLADTDGGGFDDYQEVVWYDSDPLDPADDGPDTDDDGLFDWQEAIWGTDPNDYDTDGDGLDDGLEVYFGLSPLLTDTDGGGADDYTEFWGFCAVIDVNPLNPADDWYC